VTGRPAGGENKCRHDVKSTVVMISEHLVIYLSRLIVTCSSAASVTAGIRLTLKTGFEYSVVEIFKYSDNICTMQYNKSIYNAHMVGGRAESEARATRKDGD